MSRWQTKLSSVDLGIGGATGFGTPDEQENATIEAKTRVIEARRRMA